MRSIQAISQEVDSLAINGCRLMTEEEKTKFFETSSMKRTYPKGINKGKPRELFEINGKIFNKIWGLVYPYIKISCIRSVYYDAYEVDDAISEVKLTLFGILRRLGPVYRGQTLSQRLSLIVNISLTNNYHKRSRVLKTVSISQNSDNNNDFENDDIEIVEPNDNMKHVEFWLDVPANLKPHVGRILAGSNLSETAKHFGENKKKMKAELSKILV